MHPLRRRREFRPRPAWLVVSALVVAGCASGLGAFPADSTARRARDLPRSFARPGGLQNLLSDSPGGCESVMIDPRDGTELRLVRSQAGRGDYAVPTGRYDVAAGELLRLDCRTGEAIGIVERSPHRA